MIYLQVKDKELELLFIQPKQSKIIVNKSIRVPLPSPLVVNGFIQDEDLFVRQISDVVQEHNLKNNKVVLTLDSTFIVYRELSTPVLRKKQLDAFVYHNLRSQINTIEEYTIDYAILKRDKKLQVLAIAAPINLLEVYRRLLKQAGLALSRITTSPLNMIRGYEMMDQKLNLSSQIYVYFNGEIINSVLFNHGNYVFANAYRTFVNDSSDVSIMERISQLMQFQKAQASGIQVERVNIYGDIEKSMLPVMAETLKTTIVCDEFPAVIENLTSLPLYPLMSSVFASLPSRLRNYNLLKGIKQDQFTARFAQKKRLSSILWLLVINIIAVGVLGIYMYVVSSQELARKHDLQSRLDNPALLNKYRKVLELSGLNSLFEKQVEESQAVVELIDDQKAFNLDIYESLLSLKPGDVKWSSLSYQGDSLILAASAQNRNSTYAFISNLRNSGLFNDVSYSGFVFNESTKRYDYQINILLKVGVME